MSKPQVLIDDLLRQSRVRATGTAPQLDLFSVFGVFGVFGASASQTLTDQSGAFTLAP